MSKKRYKRIYIEITNRCNLRCSFCSQHNRPLLDMSLNNFEYILKEIDSYTDYIYLHVKGEPLLHPQFIQILDLCKQYHKQVQLVTNGTCLSSYDLSIFNHSALRKISISLHSIDEHSLPIDSYFNTIQTLLETVNCYIELRFWNRESIQKSTRCMQLLNKISVYCSISINELLEGDQHRLKEKQFLNFDESFIWPDYKGPIYSTIGTCLATKQMLAILVDGNVIPCCLDGQGDLSIGNIFTDNIEILLSSYRYEKIHTGFLTNVLKEELCQKCEYRTRFK